MGQKISMTLMSGGRLFKKTVIGLMAGVIIAAGSYAVVQAATYDGTVFGRGPWVGYFDKNEDNSGDYVLSGGVPYSVNSVESFMSFLKAANKSGDNQRVAGSAFIVNTMLGRNGPGNGRDVSDADWNDLTRRLQDRQNKGKINWNKWVDNYSDDRRINSYYQLTGSGDDAFYSVDREGDGIEILDDSGNVIYTLVRACANPIGELLELPEVGWSITPTIEINRTTAMPGDNIIWKHTITVGGFSATDKDVSYYYQNREDLKPVNENGRKYTLRKPANVGKSVYHNSNYTVSLYDAGKTLCRVTIAIPGASNNSNSVESAEACVLISGAPTENVCRPITVNIPGHNDVWGSAVSIKVYAINDFDGTRKNFGSTTGGRVDLTSNCTTGDKWKVYIDIAKHPQTKHRHCSGHPCHYGSYHTNSYADPPASILTTIGPCYDYKLTTSVKPLNQYAVEVNSYVSGITPSISSASYTATSPSWLWFFNVYGKIHTKSKVTKWQVSKLIVEPNNSVPTLPNQNSTSDPCTYYKSQGFYGCEPFSSGSNTVFKKDDNPTNVLSGSNPLLSLNYTVGDYEAGTRICFAFSVYLSQSDPNNSSSSAGGGDQWNNSAVNGVRPEVPCLIVVKKPKVQIWGGDLSVGKAADSSSVASISKVETSTSVKNISGFHTFGSWVEYGIFATGLIKGMASGSAFAGATGLASAASTATCSYSTLSFTNAGNSFCTESTTKGNYANTQIIPDVVASFPSAGRTISTGTLSPNSLTPESNGVYIGTRTGNLTLTQSELSPGKSVILKVSGTVTITGNQTYKNDNNGVKYTSISQLPQLLIIANNINIVDSVTNVDAWLIAKNGSINTCSSVAVGAPLSANLCSNPLSINGPIMAKKLYLRRTAGSSVAAKSGDPAEILNLRADAYLWAFARATSSGSVQTVYTTELPPRF